MHRARTDEAKDKRKQIILKAALDEFFERGFSAARMDDIAQRADISKGTLYLYFSSKEALFEGLVDSIARPNLERIRAAVSANISVPDAVRAMLALVPTMLTTSNLPRLMKIIIGESNAFPKVVKSYRQNIIDPLLNTVSTILENAQKRGEIQIGDPALTARLLFAPIAFSGMWQIVFGRDPEAYIDLDAQMKLHAEMFIRSVSCKGETI